MSLWRRRDREAGRRGCAASWHYGSEKRRNIVYMSGAFLCTCVNCSVYLGCESGILHPVAGNAKQGTRGTRPVPEHSTGGGTGGGGALMSSWTISSAPPASGMLLLVLPQTSPRHRSPRRTRPSSPASLLHVCPGASTYGITPWMRFMNCFLTASRKTSEKRIGCRLYHLEPPANIPHDEEM